MRTVWPRPEWQRESEEECNNTSYVCVCLHREITERDRVWGPGIIGMQDCVASTCGVGTG